MRKLIYTLIAFVVMCVFSLTAAIGSPASFAADSQQSTEEEYPSCVGVDYNVGAGTCVDEVTSQSSSTDKAKSKVKSVNGVKIKSNVTVLSFIKAKGISKKDKAGARVHVLKQSMSLWTSYYNIYGQKVWHSKFYFKGHRFFWHHDGWHDGLCDNDVVIPGAKGPRKPPPGAIKVFGKVKIVPRFKFSGKSSSLVKGVATSKSVSYANLYNEAGQQTCHSYSDATAEAYYRARGKARFSGRVFISLKQAVEALQSGANLDLQSKMDANTTFEFIGRAVSSAKGIATTETSTKASCISHIPPERLTCPEVYGPGYSGEYPDCKKDGTTTPPPPPDAPGPNPPPSDPGESHQCYSEETGEPVPANSDGTCPVDSFGS